MKGKQFRGGLVLVALLPNLLIAGERFSGGVKGRVPGTDAFDAAQGASAACFTTTKRYLVGPTMEFHSSARFSLEVDARDKRLGYSYEVSSPLAAARTVANSWEFPVPGKFEVLPGPLRPFAAAGVSLRHLSGIKQVRQTTAGANFDRVEFNTAAEFNKRNDVGLALGFGVAFKLGPVRISPEFCWMRWAERRWAIPSMRSCERTAIRATSWWASPSN